MLPSRILVKHRIGVLMHKLINGNVPKPLLNICQLDTIILAIYADDTQLYISFKCKDLLELLKKLNMCISNIRVWMIKNKLKINDSKTEFIIFRSPLLKQI